MTQWEYFEKNRSGDVQEPQQITFILHLYHIWQQRSSEIKMTFRNYSIKNKIKIKKYCSG